jgi:hypothetical protein
MPALLERLRATVAERRASGEYPPDLEADLDAHFRRIIASRAQMPRLATLHRRIEEARRASRFSPDRIPTSTRLPGGAVLHKGMSRLFLRQAIGILDQVKEFADRTLEALDAAAAVAESPDTHRHADLVELVDAHSELLAGRLSTAAPAADDLQALALRVEMLEHEVAERRWRPWFGRNRFDAVFDRGERDRLRRAASAALDGRTPVLCVEVAAGASPLATLATTADASLGAVVAVSVEDTLSAQQMVDLIAMAFEKLSPEGRLVLSRGTAPSAPSPEPQSEPSTPSEPSAPLRPTFDPTLGPSLPARYAVFVCREAGFSTVDCEEWSPDGYLVVATR